MKNTLFYLLFLMTGCIEKELQFKSVPAHVLNTANVTIYSIPENSKKILLSKDRTYGDTGDIIFSRMGEFAVDREGRIFIEESAVGRKTIHAFDSNGNYLGNIGREGRGPGEFEETCCLTIKSNKLYVYDSVQSRMSVFSLNNLELLSVYNVDKTNLSGTNVDGRFIGTYFHVSSEKILMGFGPPDHLYENRKNHYYTYFYYNKEFQQESSEVLKQKQIPSHWGYFQERRIKETFPFFEKPLIAVSETGRIFTAMSNDFFVLELDKHGNYLRSFYYPHEKLKVTREDAYKSSNVMSRNIAEDIELPEYWPILNSMQFDELDRLWISTFTDREDQLKWWILNKDGELLGTFYFQGDRYAWPLRSAEKTKVIQNGYFYALQRNDETGTSVVNRYQIKIEGN